MDAPKLGGRLTLELKGLLMKEQILNLQKLDRAVKFVSILVLICLIAVAVALALAIAKEDKNAITAYAAAGGPLLAALSVALIADRQITNENIRKNHEHNLAIVQSMHQVVFYGEDLKDLIGFIKHCYEREDVRPSIAVLGIHQKIQHRFDQISADHIHKWMSGECTTKLHKLRPSIFGMCLRLSEMERDARAAGVKLLPLSQTEGKLFEGPIKEVDAFIEAVIQKRKEIDY